MHSSQSSISPLLFVALACLHCGDDPSETIPSAGDRPYRGYQASTLRFGSADNPESVRLLPGGQSALVLSSKSRRLSLIDLDKEAMSERRSASLFEEDPGEGELTNLDIDSQGHWAALTHTLVDQDREGRVVSCSGELVFVDVRDQDSFGSVLRTVEVGPMPDAVDITADDRWAVVANERDVVWGKCEALSEELAPPSVSLVDVSDGPTAARETRRLELSGAREPESVATSGDNDLVAVTLQDSHELAFFRISDPDAMNIVAAPQNSLGADAWPDGIVRFSDAMGREHFAIAGEANDTLSIFDPDGTVLSTVEIGDSDVPSELPRLGADSWGPQFQPDSLSPFSYDGESYIAMSLKSAGAILVARVGNAAEPEVVSVVAVGEDTAPAAEQIGSEGIAAGAGGAVIVANEAEGTISLVLPVTP